MEQSLGAGRGRRFRLMRRHRSGGFLLLSLVPALVPAPSAQGARPTGTVVVSNMSDNTVTVIDVADGRVAATLPTGEGPHEVAISRDGRTALVSNYGVRGKPGHTITVIDVAKATVVRTLTLETVRRPHGMAFLPGDTIVAVSSETTQQVALVDVRSGTVLRLLPTRGRTSHMVALTARADRLFTGNIADGTISMVDVSGRDSTVTVKVARQPEGIAVAPDGSVVWAGSNQDSIVVVVDARRGVAVDTIRGFGLPYRIAISADGALAVVTDPAKGEVRGYDVQDRRERFRVVVPRDSLVETAEVKGSPSPEGVALSRDGKFAFVTLQGRNRVITIDVARGAIIAYAPTGTWSDGIGYSPVTVRLPE